jgi:hypothetical protein
MCSRWESLRPSSEGMVPERELLLRCLHHRQAHSESEASVSFLLIFSVATALMRGRLTYVSDG